MRILPILGLVALAACSRAVRVPPAKLVIQAPFVADPRVYRAGAPKVLASHDASLVAVLGHGLAILDGRTGAVRARSASCATAAAFASDDRSLYFLGCPAGAVQGPTGAELPEVAVIRWDLDADREARIASGHYAGIALTAGGDGLIVTGVHAARVLDLHGAERAVFDASASASITRVAPRGDRALQDQDVIVRPGAAPRRIALGQGDELSPDLERAARIAGDGALVVTDVDAGAEIVRRPIGERCRVLGWSPGSDRLAVGCDDRGGVTVVVDARGATACTVERAALPAGEELTGLRFSRDGAHLLLGLRRTAGYELRVLRVPGCAVEHVELAGDGWLDAAVGDDLTSVHVEAAEAGPLASLLLLRPTGAPARTELPVRTLPPLEALPDGRLRFGGKGTRATCEPVAETCRFEPRPSDESTTSGAGVVALGRALFVALPDGALSPLSVPLAKGAGASLVLVGGGGERTPLAGSEGRAPFSQCGPSPREGYVSCVCGGRLFLWDARTGRRVFDSGGVLPGPSLAYGLAFSPGEERVLVDASSALALVKLGSGQVIGVYPGGVRTDPFQAWSPDGKLVADGGVGMIDGDTGAVLWQLPLEQPFGRWLPDGDRIAVARESVSERTWGDTRARLEVRDGRSGKEIGALGDDVAILGFGAGGQRMLTVDAASIHRVRDTSTLAELARAGPFLSAALSADGRFLFAEASGAVWVRRLADGAEMVQVPPDREGVRGLSYTASGLFDGGPEALAWVAYRNGDVRTGKLLRWDDVTPSGRRPGLAAQFFAGP